MTWNQGPDIRRKGTSDAVSGETEAPSSHEGDEDEEEEESGSDPAEGVLD